MLETLPHPCHDSITLWIFFLEILMKPCLLSPLLASLLEVSFPSFLFSLLFFFLILSLLETHYSRRQAITTGGIVGVVVAGVIIMVAVVGRCLYLRRHPTFAGKRLADDAVM